MAPTTARTVYTIRTTPEMLKPESLQIAIDQAMKALKVK